MSRSRMSHLISRTNRPFCGSVASGALPFFLRLYLNALEVRSQRVGVEHDMDSRCFGIGAGK
jgi:hypothetical protein